MNLYQILRRMDPGYAARTFEELFPEAGARRSAAKLFAQLIQKASEATSAWNVTLDSDSIRLNVGPVRVASFFSGGIWFCVAGKRAKDWPEWLRSEPNRRRNVYKSVPILSSGVEFDSARTSRLPRSVIRSAAEYLAAAGARRKGRSTWVRAHSPGFIEFLEAYLTITLPRPALAGEPMEKAGERGPSSQKAQAFEEGALRRVYVNKYERSASAKRACLAHFGYQCQCCGVVLAERYSPLSAPIVHVHHLEPLSGVGPGYRPDPVRNLRPVCPNCHSVIHSEPKAKSLGEVRKLLRTGAARGPKTPRAGG